MFNGIILNTGIVRNITRKKIVLTLKFKQILILKKKILDHQYAVMVSV